MGSCGLLNSILNMPAHKEVLIETYSDTVLSLLKVKVHVYPFTIHKLSYMTNAGTGHGHLSSPLTLPVLGCTLGYQPH
jgi:hypothetical protein